MKEKIPRRGTWEEAGELYKGKQRKSEEKTSGLLRQEPLLRLQLVLARYKRRRPNDERAGSTYRKRASEAGAS
jgi:hypothetical protein